MAGKKEHEITQHYGYSIQKYSLEQAEHNTLFASLNYAKQQESFLDRFFSKLRNHRKAFENAVQAAGCISEFNYNVNLLYSLDDRDLVLANLIARMKKIEGLHQVCYAKIKLAKAKLSNKNVKDPDYLETFKSAVKDLQVTEAVKKEVEENLGHLSSEGVIVLAQRLQKEHQLLAQQVEALNAAKAISEIDVMSSEANKHTYDVNLSGAFKVQENEFHPFGHHYDEASKELLLLKAKCFFSQEKGSEEYIFDGLKAIKSEISHFAPSVLNPFASKHEKQFFKKQKQLLEMRQVQAKKEAQALAQHLLNLKIDFDGTDLLSDDDHQFINDYLKKHGNFILVKKEGLTDYQLLDFIAMKKKRAGNKYATFLTKLENDLLSNANNQIDRLLNKNTEAKFINELADALKLDISSLSDYIKNPRNKSEVINQIDELIGKHDVSVFTAVKRKIARFFQKKKPEDRDLESLAGSNSKETVYGLPKKEIKALNELKEILNHAIENNLPKTDTLLAIETKDMQCFKRFRDSIKQGPNSNRSLAFLKNRSKSAELINRYVGKIASISSYGTDFLKNYHSHLLAEKFNITVYGKQFGLADTKELLDELKTKTSQNGSLSDVYSYIRNLTKYDLPAGDQLNYLLSFLYSGVQHQEVKKLLALYLLSLINETMKKVEHITADQKKFLDALIGRGTIENMELRERNGILGVLFDSCFLYDGNLSFLQQEISKANEAEKKANSKDECNKLKVRVSTISQLKNYLNLDRLSLVNRYQAHVDSLSVNGVIQATLLGKNKLSSEQIEDAKKSIEVAIKYCDNKSKLGMQQSEGYKALLRMLNHQYQESDFIIEDVNKNLKYTFKEKFKNSIKSVCQQVLLYDGALANVTTENEDVVERIFANVYENNNKELLDLSNKQLTRELVQQRRSQIESQCRLKGSQYSGVDVDLLTEASYATVRLEKYFKGSHEFESAMLYDDVMKLSASSFYYDGVFKDVMNFDDQGEVTYEKKSLITNYLEKYKGQSSEFGLFLLYFANPEQVKQFVAKRFSKLCFNKTDFAFLNAVLANRNSDTGRAALEQLNHVITDFIRSDKYSWTEKFQNEVVDKYCNASVRKQYRLKKLGQLVNKVASDQQFDSDVIIKGINTSPAGDVNTCFDKDVNKFIRSLVKYGANIGEGFNFKTDKEWNRIVSFYTADAEKWDLLQELIAMRFSSEKHAQAIRSKKINNLIDALYDGDIKKQKALFANTTHYFKFLAEHKVNENYNIVIESKDKYLNAIKKKIESKDFMWNDTAEYLLIKLFPKSELLVELRFSLVKDLLANKESTDVDLKTDLDCYVNFLAQHDSAIYAQYSRSKSKIIDIAYEMENKNHLADLIKKNKLQASNYSYTKTREEIMRVFFAAQPILFDFRIQHVRNCIEAGDYSGMLRIIKTAQYNKKYYEEQNYLRPEDVNKIVSDLLDDSTDSLPRNLTARAFIKHFSTDVNLKQFNAKMVMKCLSTEKKTITIRRLI